MKTFFYRFYTHLQRVIEALIHDDTDNLIFDHFMTWYIYPYLITLDASKSGVLIVFTQPKLLNETKTSETNG